MTPVAIAEDRSLSVPPGQIIRTGYVSVWKVRLASRERMAIGDVKDAFERQMQMGDHQRWPCPRGEWDGDEFVIIDGRHAYVAALMLGLDFIFVAWPEETKAPAPDVSGDVGEMCKTVTQVRANEARGNANLSWGWPKAWREPNVDGGGQG